MTKKVRVENADTSTYVVAVEEHDGNPTGFAVTLLRNPADLLDFTIHSGKYLVVREATAEELK